jgi:Tfp pilus assembly protein PilE
MILGIHQNNFETKGFTLVEAVLTFAIIGILSALAISAVSNGARDTHSIVARQQQSAVQEALVAWVMSQSRVGNTAQVRSLASLRNENNTLSTTNARFNKVLPNPSASDPGVRAGFLDQTAADHFEEFRDSSDKLHTAALTGAAQNLTLPDWIDGGFPTVQLNDETL